MCIYNLSNTTQDHRVKSGGTDKGKEATTFSSQLLAQASQANLLHVWVRDSMTEKSKQMAQRLLFLLFWLEMWNQIFRTSEVYPFQPHEEQTLSFKPEMTPCVSLIGPT